MILDLTLERDKKTNKVLGTPAPFDPDDAVKERTAQVMKDFGLANTARNRPYREFNNLSLIQRMNQDQLSWNQFVEPPSDDPAQAWRSRAFRPIVRNKIIAIAAHLTASIIYPKIYAQNDEDKEDRLAAVVMRDLMEWANDRARYDKTFIATVVCALVNPASIIHTEFAEHYRIVKREEDGKIVEKEMLDEAFSGFQDSVVPCDELFIANFYEHDIQKQPYLIWRRMIDYSTARLKYQGNERFEKYVRPGIQYLYSSEEKTFFEKYDEELRGELVEEVIYFNRSGDLRLTFVNGVLIDDVDQMNPREDKQYPFAKSGYELIHEKFFYYKSLAFKLANDEEVVNTAYRMLADGTYLQIMPPAVIFGTEEIRNSIIAPGMVTAIADPQPNASFQTIQTNNNLGAAFNLLSKVEGSISESSSDNLQSGQAQGGSAQTAFEISRLEQNARVMLGLFGKMIGFLVKEFGELRVSDILQFLSVADVTELAGDSQKLKFKTFLLPEKSVGGKTKTRKIQFTEELPDEMTKEQELEESFKVAKKEVEEKDEVQIMKVNPTLFRKRRFMLQVSPEAILPKSDALKKAISLEEYALAIQNPLVDPMPITRDLLLGSFDATKDDVDKYIKKEPAQQLGLPPQGGEVPAPKGAQGAVLAEAGATNPAAMAAAL